MPDSNQDVELVSGSTFDDISRTPPRMPECHSRFRVEEQEGPLRMGIKTRDLPEDSGDQGELPDRSVCFPPVGQTPNILQLETRSGCNGYRRPCSRLEQHNRVCFSPFCLIGRCLTKIKRERVPRVILITPPWHSQPWFPVLMGMITDTPLLLPTITDFY